MAWKFNPLTGKLELAWQAILVSGTSIKTVGGQSLLGSGDVPIDAPTIAQYNALQDRVTALENIILNGRVGWDGKLD